MNIKIFIILFFSFSTYSFSQSNLQFNSVIARTGTLSGGPGQQAFSQIFTVPIGKVWKLERYRRDALYVNGINIKDSYTFSGGGIAIDNAPLWLNEGDSFYFVLGSPPQSWSDNWYFSLLEFNKQT